VHLGASHLMEKMGDGRRETPAARKQAKPAEETKNRR